MSNWTQVDIEARKFGRFRQQCRDELRDCFGECDRLAAGLSETREGLRALGTGLATSLTALSEQLADLPAVVHELQASTTALDERLGIIEQQRTQIEALGRQYLAASIQTTEQTAATLRESREQLGRLESEISQSMAEVRELGVHLADCFDRVDDVLESLDSERERGTTTATTLNRTWDDVQLTHQKMAAARSEWMRIQGHIGATATRLDERLSSMSMMLDSLEASGTAVYDILQTLMEDDFALVAYQRTADGIEAFLKDGEDRMIAVQLRPRAEAADRLLLELDLKNFEPAGEHEECDRESDDILDRLRDVGMVHQCSMGHPDRQTPFAQKRVQTPQRATQDARSLHRRRADLRG